MHDLESSSVLFPVALFDVVALAASTGGLEALSQILDNLPIGFPAAITIVQHLAPDHRSFLPQIFAHHTSLTVKQAEAGEALKAGIIYIAPPDHHLLIAANGTLQLSQTERVNFVRPSADQLFSTLAMSCKQRAIAVVLSGYGHDGAMGIQQVKRLGGVTIVQDPATAEAPAMPLAAINTGAVDLILPLHQIAPTLVKLVQHGMEKVCEST